MVVTVVWRGVVGEDGIYIFEIPRYGWELAVVQNDSWPVRMGVHSVQVFGKGFAVYYVFVTVNKYHSDAWGSVDDDIYCKVQSFINQG
jgi:hypothetical protein